MQLQIEVSQEALEAIEYCIDNKLTVFTGDQVTVEDVIKIYLDRSFKSMIDAVTQQQNSEIVQVVRKEPNLKTQVDSIIASIKASIVDEKAIVDEKGIINEQGT